MAADATMLPLNVPKCPTRPSAKSDMTASLPASADAGQPAAIALP